MKTNTNILSEMPTFATTALNEFAAASAAKQKAIRAFDAAKEELVTAVSEIVNSEDAPIVVNADLAKALGCHPSQVSAILYRWGNEKGITSTSVKRTRRYAEVDSDGNLMEGGKVIEKSHSLTAWKKRSCH